MVKPLPYHEFEKLSENTFQVLADYYGFDLDAYRDDPDCHLSCTRKQVAQIQSLKWRINEVTGYSGLLTGLTITDQLESLYNSIPGSWRGAWFALDACSKAFAAFAIPILREWLKSQRSR